MNHWSQYKVTDSLCKKYQSVIERSLYGIKYHKKKSKMVVEIQSIQPSADVKENMRKTERRKNRLPCRVNPTVQERNPAQNNRTLAKKKLQEKTPLDTNSNIEYSNARGVSTMKHPRKKGKESQVMFNSRGSKTSRRICLPDVSVSSTPCSQTVLDRDRLICPICVEKFDDLELRFTPCPCGYRVCAMCIHLIKEKADGKCPNCRDEYLAERGHLAEEIGMELQNILSASKTEEAVKSAEFTQRNPKSRNIVLPRDSGKRKKPGKQLWQDPTPRNVVPLVVAAPSYPPLVEPVVRLTRFTGGVSVWD